MNATVEILRRPGKGNEYGFDPVTGGLTIPNPQGGETYPELILIYRGKARVVNNKDWRARVRTQRGDSGTDHAIRVQAPLHLCPPVFASDLVRVIGGLSDDEGNLKPLPDPELAHYVLHVRNPLMSSNAWLRNVLCDVDAMHPQALPPPFTLEPVVMQGDITGP